MFYLIYMWRDKLYFNDLLYVLYVHLEIRKTIQFTNYELLYERYIYQNDEFINS